MTSISRAAALGALVAMSLAGSGCFGGDDDSDGEAAAGGEVVITCEACPTTAPDNDPFAQYRKELTEAFNEEYAGRYRIDPKPYTPANDADSAQHYQRAAATDTLPDLFTDQATVVRDVARSGKLVDFAPILDADALARRLPARRVPQPDRRRRARLGHPRAARRRRHLLQQGAVRAGRASRRSRRLGTTCSAPARRSRRAARSPSRWTATG